MKLRKQETSLKLYSVGTAKKWFVFATLFLAVLGFLFLYPVTLENLTAQADTNATDPTIAISASGLISLNPTAGGTTSSSSATVTTATTNYTGYYLYLSSESSQMQMIGGGASDTIDSLSFATAPTSDSFIDKWGYKIGDGTNYNAIPTASTEIASLSSASAGDAKTLYLAARAGKTKAQGAYVGSLTLTATPNPNKTYSITYYRNTDESVSNFPSSVGETTGSASQVTISDMTPTRTNYNFIEWCTVETAASACSGTAYDPNDIITLDPTTNNAIKLYAVWKPVDRTVTIATDGTGYGTVNRSSLIVPHGSSVAISSNQVTINGTTTTATAAAQTSQYSYAFSSWTNNCGSTITGNCTITANFSRMTRSYTITFATNDSSYGSVSPASVSKTYGTALPTSGAATASITIDGTTITATPSSGYKFTDWTHSCGSTLTVSCTITANFESDVTTFAQAYAAASKSQYNGYYQMHEMTTSICSAVSSGQSAQLIDRRDSKKYWVTKLADGNCWMTQNLDFNINSSTLTYLNSSDATTYTDLSSAWSLISTYYTKTATSSSSTNTDYYSWDLGDYYYVPSGNTGWSSCGTSATSYSGCTSKGFSTTKPTADAKGKTLTSAEAEHYQVGTLYQWCAATAGTCSSATSSGATASGSICPKGWRLPYSGNNTTDKGFGYLLSQSTYNLVSSYDKLKISADPLYFVPGGNVYSGTLRSAGNNGYYWSSQAYGSSYAYDLYFRSSGVDPSNGNSRYYGLSVRCVAR